MTTLAIRLTFQIDLSRYQAISNGNYGICSREEIEDEINSEHDDFLTRNKTRPESTQQVFVDFVDFVDFC